MLISTQKYFFAVVKVARMAASGKGQSVMGRISPTRTPCSRHLRMALRAMRLVVP